MSKYSFTEIHRALRRIANHPLRGDEKARSAVLEEGTVVNGKRPPVVEVLDTGDDTIIVRVTDVGANGHWTADVYVMSPQSFQGFAASMLAILREP